MATVVPFADGILVEPPSLFDGQQLLQPEFHRLYEACPKHLKFELIDGVVHKAAARVRANGRNRLLLTSLLIDYEVATPGIEGLSNATTILDERNEAQPDLQLRIWSDYGGRTVVTPDQYLSGPPELVIDLFNTRINLDLSKKLIMYQTQGVHEYLAVYAHEATIQWFVWPDGEQGLNPDGILKSVAFPGLWIHSEALFQERLSDLKATLLDGLNQSAHAEFITKLQETRSARD